MGFFDNMGDRPISGVSTKWRRDTIAGTIDSDAKTIVFGAMVLRDGSFLIDDLRFEVETPEGWKSLDINGRFEDDKSGKDPAHWNYNKNDAFMTVAVVSGQAAEGKKAVEVGRMTAGNNAAYAKELFPVNMPAGTLLRKDIGNGLSIEMPLALWGDGKATYPLTDTAAARALSDKRSADLPTPLTGEYLYLRLANTCITWNIYQHFHPYFKEWTTDWDQDLRTAIASCYRDKTDIDFEGTLAVLNARLHDGHTFVTGPQTYAHRAFLPLRLTWADNSLVVTEALTTASKAQRGNVITAINGRPTNEYLKERSTRVSAGSDNAMIRQTIANMVISRPDSSLRLTFRSKDGKEWQETLPFSLPRTHITANSLLPAHRPIINSKMVSSM